MEKKEEIEDRRRKKKEKEKEMGNWARGEREEEKIVF